ncbi:hypothetical protein LINPERPRIM_LOCUS2484 [Linum perenne]
MGGAQYWWLGGFGSRDGCRGWACLRRGGQVPLCLYHEPWQLFNYKGRDDGSYRGTTMELGCWVQEGYSSARLPSSNQPTHYGGRDENTTCS